MLRSAVRGAYATALVTHLEGGVAVTADGVPISVRHDTCLLTRPVTGGAAPAAGGERELAVVVGHGFTGTWRHPEVRAVVEALRPWAGVVSLDFRGHGASGGLSTVGGDEPLDLDAAVRHARDLGYRRVVTAGFSMGAAVAVRHAALLGGVDGVVSVSGPSRWRYRGTRPMRLLHTIVATRAGRELLARARDTHVRPGPWEPFAEAPDAVAGRIAPTPMLVVHGTADGWFPLEHAHWLTRAAPHAELWEVPGFGHAEGSMTPELTGRIARWARDAAGLPA